jgi:hypothetical protein
VKRYVLAEFGAEASLYGAARTLRESGFDALDIHSPYPLHGADEALGLKRSKVPLVALLGGLFGAAAGYLLQVWTVGIDWPLNVGGRPAHSAPAFIPVTFELGVLVASLSIFFGLLFGFFGFPRTHHPVFEVEEFRSATIDAMWLSAEVDAGESERVSSELRRLGARQVLVVPEATR